VSVPTGAKRGGIGLILNLARPQFVVGENVPGLLSSGGGRDFGAIAESLVELGYRVAWRVLDLRYFGVPQRRRRVFIVASLGDGRCAEILFEPESLFGNPAEGREAGEEDSQDVAGSLRSRGGGRDSTTGNGGVVAYIPEVAPSLAASGVGAGRTGNERNELDFCVAEPIPIQNATRGKSQNGLGIASAGDPMYTVDVGSQHGVAEHGIGVAQGWRVRRLSGLPDGSSSVIW